MKKNLLRHMMCNEMKSRPYFIETDVWIRLKDIYDKIKAILVEEVLETDIIRKLDIQIEKKLNSLVEVTDDSGLYEAHCHLTGLLDYYLEVAVDNEMFEIAANLYKLIDMLAVKVPLYKN